MKLKKELVDELIRATKEYYGNSYNKPYILDNLGDADKEVRKKSNFFTVDLIKDMARYTEISRRGTYEDIYKALAIFGVIVE